MADEAYTHMVKEIVFSEDVFGSLVSRAKFEHDTLIEIMAWLHSVIADIPEQYRASAKMEIESVGGYDGEHHSEVHVYYMRPETETERAARAEQERRWAREEIQRAKRRLEEAEARLRRGD